MSKSFDQLKKSRTKNFEKLNKQLNEMASKGYSNPDADKYWKLTVDSSGNGYAVIRFLPPPKEEDIPFVRIWDHGFQGPGGWYIEKSLTTIGKDDPVSEYNSSLWNSTNDDESPERKQARKQKRRLQYVSNIYVIKDPANPENEGKVFLYSYGKKIFDKINDMAHPSFEDETAVDVFDFWGGANFRLKARNVDGYRNYDKSDFDDPRPLFDDDDELEKIWEQQYSLQELIDPKNFKSYDELKERLNRVLKISGSGVVAATAEDESDEIDMSKLGGEDSEPSMKEETVNLGDSDDDDDLSFFKKLAEE